MSLKFVLWYDENYTRIGPVYDWAKLRWEPITGRHCRKPQIVLTRQFGWSLQALSAEHAEWKTVNFPSAISFASLRRLCVIFILYPIFTYCLFDYLLTTSWLKILIQQTYRERCLINNSLSLCRRLRIKFPPHKCPWRIFIEHIIKLWIFYLFYTRKKSLGRTSLRWGQNIR